MTRPFRHTVRVFVFRGDQVYLGKRKINLFGNKATIPGGGIEEGNKEDSCARECLEEAGLIIDGITPLNYEVRQVYSHRNSARSKQYEGVHLYFYMAKYLGTDNSLYNAEGDGLRPMWVNVEDFEEVYLKWNGNEAVNERETVLEAYKRALIEREKLTSLDPTW